MSFRYFTTLVQLAASILIFAFCLPVVAQEATATSPSDQWLKLTEDRELARSDSDQSEAIELGERALEVARKAFGKDDLRTLSSLGNLGVMYEKRGDISKAEPLLIEALKDARKLLGTNDTSTLNIISTLGVLYYKSTEYDRAEPLLREALAISRELQARGEKDPELALRQTDLEGLYLDQLRYDRAEDVYKEALKSAQSNPKVFVAQSWLIHAFVDQKKWEQVVWLLQHLEPILFGSGNQVSEGAGTREYLALRAAFQSAALSSAISTDHPWIRRLASDMISRLKLTQDVDDVLRARAMRNSRDRRVRRLADEVRALRTRLPPVALGDPSVYRQTLFKLKAKERELDAVVGQARGSIKEVKTVDDLRKLLPEGAALVVFREIRGKKNGAHFAAMLLSASIEPTFADVDNVELPNDIIDDKSAVDLFGKLFGRFEQLLATATTVYIVPDGSLNRAPFAQLKLADGHYWIERQQLRLLQSGLSLLDSGPEKSARGLLAIGDVDFGPDTPWASQPSKILSVNVDELGSVTSDEGYRPGNFKRLVQSGKEVEQIREIYGQLRKEEPTEVWLRSKASKARLLMRSRPPRALHLATHGFYLPLDHELMLDSGVALAGANRDLNGTGSSGILYALEAKGLNLEGTELVTLSACDTAIGTPDYSDGVYGLARAFRVAGARSVLVTLWAVKDDEARDFMAAFYRTWLSQEENNPAKALRDTQLSYIRDQKKSDPSLWAPYILVE